jgi:hypothetical protein
MSKGGEFKGDSADKGYRLGELRASGLTAMQRRYVPVEESEGLRPKAHRDIEWSEPAKEVMSLNPNTINPLSKAPGVGVRRSGPRGGRPKVEGVRPWDAAGVSKATWFRRKKEAGGAGE